MGLGLGLGLGFGLVAQHLLLTVEGGCVDEREEGLLERYIGER